MNAHKISALALAVEWNSMGRMSIGSPAQPTERGRSKRGRAAIIGLDSKYDQWVISKK